MPDDLQKRISVARAKGERFLLSKQDADGAWRGEVDLNPGPTAQVLMLHAFIGREVPQKFVEKALRYFARTQNPDGGWSTHFGVPSDVSVTTEVYIGLRLGGVPASAEICVRAAARIAALGGLEYANPWTQLYCAVLGVLPWDKIYKTPVEVMMIPEWLPIAISKLSYWVKVITIPMALLGAVGPGSPIALADDLRRELSVDWTTFKPNLDSPVIKFLMPLVNASLKSVPGLRSRAIAKALAAIEDFKEDHGDYGGNTCTAMVVLLVKKCMGTDGDVDFERGLACLLGYAHETSEEWRIQCCQSHVWDTAFALSALSVGSEPAAVGRATEWLRANQILDTYGPWHSTVTAEPGGWCFGDRHKHFPVTDCTAVSLLALAKHDPSFAASQGADRGVAWLRAMQHAGGGWSAYEKYTQGLWMNKLFKFKDIPDALVDVPKGDVSSKVLEALVHFKAPVAGARSFLLAIRESGGLWRGNYGINYIYGTAFAARALRELDGRPSDDWALPARRFFLGAQNSDGGFGEVEASYFDRPLAGTGESSVVQTSWALMGLVACSSGSSDELRAIERAVSFLIARQAESGEWSDSRFLGTVFPGAVYFRYDFYPAYFPLMALESARSALEA